MSRRGAPAMAALLAVLASVLVGCSDDDADGLRSGDGFSVEAALAELPMPPDDAGTNVTVTVADLAAAADANDAGERPAADDENIGRWLLAATGTAAPSDRDDLPPVYVPPADVLGSHRSSPLAEVEDELGWSVLDVAALAEVSAPPFRFGVVTGEVGEGSFTAAGLEPDDDGIVSVGEGEDGEVDHEGVSAARPLGTPLRMAADGDRVALSTSTDAVAGWVDGGATSLADDDDLRAIAAALDDTGAVAAYLTVVPERWGYRALGIGWSVEDGEPRMTLAYAFEGEGAAEAGADQVEAAFDGVAERTSAPLADLLELDEVRADGTVVVARLRLGPEGRPQAPLELFLQGDALFVLE